MEPLLHDLFYHIEEDHWWWRGRRRIGLAILDSVAPGPVRLLDVGCGMGAWLRGLPAHIDGYGVDSSEKAVKGCLARGMKNVMLTDGQFPFADNSFDVVTAFDVLEHLDDEASVLDETCRVLKPAGHLLVTVPAFPSLATRWDVMNEHRRRYRRYGLTQTLERAGFRVDFCSYFNFVLFLFAVGRCFWERLGPVYDLPVGARVPLNPINTMIEAIFASERHWFKHRWPLPWGSSLLALAHKRELQ